MKLIVGSRDAPQLLQGQVTCAGGSGAVERRVRELVHTVICPNFKRHFFSETIHFPLLENLKFIDTFVNTGYFTNSV